VTPIADPPRVATTGGRSGEVAWSQAAEVTGAGTIEESARVRARLLGPRAHERLWGWVACLAVTLVGAIPRFWRLDRPHSLVFDEVYYVKQAYSLLKVG
jgi:hypothetical protein